MSKKLCVNEKYCKGCNICVEFCPKDVLELDNKGKIKIVDIESCIKCGICEMRCPDFAIYLEEE